MDIKALKAEESVCRELIMVKLRANAAQRGEIISVADIFRAKIVDVEEDCLIIELTGTQNKLEAFLNLLKDYEILELARTGITGLSRGSKDVAVFGSGQDRRTAGRTCGTDKASKGQDLSLYRIPPRRSGAFYSIF